jgi:Rieske 2Fe-2S family protein
MLERMAMRAFRKPSVEQAAHTLPGRYYASEEVFRAERERIFCQSWVCAGRAERIAAPGDYFLAHVAGESLIVLRDGNGTARAFYNVCRHRGARLCTEGAGQFPNTIQCPYHAWTYALDGTLLAARNMQDVEGFARRDYPLHAAGVAEWEGFVFLNLAPEPEPFLEAFAPLLGKFSAWNLAALREAHRIDYDVQANWKQIVENFSECYHCPLIHPALDRLSPSTSGCNDLDQGPFLGGFMTLRDSGGSMTTSGKTQRPPIGSVSGADLERIYYYAIFPSMLLSPHPDYVMVHLLEPRCAGRTHVACFWLFDPATMARSDFDPSDAVEFWDLTNRQDWHVCELAQGGVQSRAFQPGPYSHAEGLLHAFDREYLARMGES